MVGLYPDLPSIIMGPTSTGTSTHTNTVLGFGGLPGGGPWHASMQRCILHKEETGERTACARQI